MKEIISYLKNCLIDKMTNVISQPFLLSRVLRSKMLGNSCYIALPVCFHHIPFLSLPCFPLLHVFCVCVIECNCVMHADDDDISVSSIDTTYICSQRRERLDELCTYSGPFSCQPGNSEENEEMNSLLGSPTPLMHPLQVLYIESSFFSFLSPNRNPEKLQFLHFIYAKMLTGIAARFKLITLFIQTKNTFPFFGGNIF